MIMYTLLFLSDCVQKWVDVFLSITELTLKLLDFILFAISMKVHHH